MRLNPLLQRHQSFRKTLKNLGVAYFRNFNHLIFNTFAVIFISNTWYSTWQYLWAITLSSFISWNLASLVSQSNYEITSYSPHFPQPGNCFKSLLKLFHFFHNYISISEFWYLNNFFHYLFKVSAASILLKICIFCYTEITVHKSHFRLVGSMT